MIKKRPLLTLALVLTGLLVICGVSPAQNSKKTQSAEIKGDSMTFNWVSNEVVMTGNAMVQIEGTNPTTMTAPKMTAKLSKAGDTILTLIAYGQIHLDLTTQPDSDGVRAKITATCNDKAEYSETTQKIMLYGGAVADYLSLPEGPDSRRAHFTGDQMEADLSTSTLTVTRAHISVNAPLKQPEATPAPGAAPALEPKQ